MQIRTIGHSTRSIAEFLSLLKKHSIRCLVDIRRWPSSRKWPHFNRQPLQASLKEEGIEYAWMESLGGRRHQAPAQDSPNTGLTSPAFRNYADYMLTGEFRRAVDELLRFAEDKPTAIMCAERLFWKCHRRLLSDYLYSLGVEVLHIFDHNTVKAHRPTKYARIEERRVTYPHRRDLFTNSHDPEHPRDRPRA